MKKQWHFLLISIVVLTGLSVVSSCDKEKKLEEPIDIFMMDGNWIVIESDSNSEEVFSLMATTENSPWVDMRMRPQEVTRH